jgi:hypothetical protein
MIKQATYRFPYPLLYTRGGVTLAPLGVQCTYGSSVTPLVVRGIWSGHCNVKWQGNPSAWGKPAPVERVLSQIPHIINWGRTSTAI